jgi:ribosomal 30S subunit maturation factor RimM
LTFLGKIIKIRSNKGEVVAAASPDLQISSIKKGDTFLLKSAKYSKEKVIDYCKEIRGALVFKFIAVDTINDALPLVGYSLYGNFQQKDTPKPGILDFLVKDLEGQVWGKVINIETSDFNQLLEVESPQNEIIYIPAVDTIIKKIDKKKKIITINPPPGLKELNK